MPAIETVGPVIHGKFCSNRKELYRCGFLSNRFRVLRQTPSRFSPNSTSFRPTNTYVQARVSRGSDEFNLWGGFLRKRESSRIHANSSCEQDTDSSEKSETKSSESKGVREKSPPSPPSRREKQGKGWGWKGGGGKWRWQPIIQAQEIGVLLVQLGIVMFVMRLLRPGIPLPGSEPRTPTTVVSVPYSDFLGKINSNQVQKVEVDGVHIMFKLKSESGSVESEGGSSSNSKLQDSESVLLSVAPTKRIVYTTTRPSDIKAPYEKMLENDVEFGSPDKRSGGFLNSALIALFYVAALVGLLHRFPVSFSQHSTGQLRKRKSGNPGGAKASEQGEVITFADVAGVDEAKEELEEIVEFLRNPDRYVRVGARPPRGVLLVGLPGTGKTLLAKAVAGEAEVPFISCSASEFVELYVGMGASRVRDLFARAKKEAPSIIFIDEIDAVAKSRDGKFRIVSNDEREQTLNQLLTEMDGFDSNSAVIVLGATNRSDVLDPALRRPGRFDRVVMVETPDRTGREAILKVHVSKNELPLGEEFDLSDIASMTTGFTGADLANLVNEAALLAGRQNKVAVEKIDFIQAVERSIAGIEKKTAKLQGSEKAVVARHEAGHAVVGTAVANLLTGQPRVEKLSILPRSGGALGFTYIPPTTEDRYLLFVDELRGRLVTLLGGRAAEEVVYAGRVSTGALDDIRRATDMAYKAVAEYGLSQTIGPVSLTALSGGGSDESGTIPWGRDQGHLVDVVQGEVRALLQSALDVALSVVRANPTVLEGLGAHLEEKEKVEGEELQEWLKMVVAPKELKLFIRGKQESLLPLQTGS
ncbi:ATP-dependent zinc metalloprotease FTSH 9 like [Actinidia chinensis var. chinensis]|uniref:ATP-dependent zinc metalloprotease FTSH, chloroplastic n=1 Tax=Actinidia chinensis var. chinensis TaxID=1590841 RepID=A0A2R6P683_ACTCC|nr:ATP-dependent zinc metalloprotease FTSH 9 like [Actinidia chinensis var. chinensis]